MSEQFRLFLSNSARNRDISEEIARTRKRKDVGPLVFAAISTIEGPDARVGQYRDADAAASGLRRDSREPYSQSFCARIGRALHDHAYVQAQLCPPLPVNDS